MQLVDMDNDNDSYPTIKKNELLFVGRVNITQKRVDILLEIWHKIFLNFPDWELNIVGDGEDLNYLKNRKAYSWRKFKV